MRTLFDHRDTGRIHLVVRMNFAVVSPALKPFVIGQINEGRCVNARRSTKRTRHDVCKKDSALP